MRYYTYNEYDPQNMQADSGGHYTITVSEEDVRRTYWPYWYKLMCAKWGAEIVDKDYSFEDCLTDWVVINWAEEVKP
jgi:hypothetical protein